MKTTVTPIKMEEPAGSKDSRNKAAVPPPQRDIKPIVNAVDNAVDKVNGDGNGSGDIDWTSLALAAGGGLITHSLVSSLLDNKTDEEKRKESIWSKLLSALLPIGAGALGTYGGYSLGQAMKTASETNDWHNISIGNNQNIKTPAEYTDRVAAILNFMEENPNLEFDDIVNAANEFSAGRDTGKIMETAGNYAHLASLVPDVWGGVKIVNGAKKVVGSKPRNIALNSQKDMIRNTRTTALVPYKKPTLLDWIRNKITYKKPINGEIAGAVNSGVKELIRDRIKNSDALRAEGWKQIGRGSILTAIGLAGHTLGSYLSGKGVENQSKAHAADMFNEIVPKLKSSILEAKEVAPVAPSR